MKAHLRSKRISPKKANLVAALVRGKEVEDALNILKFTPKKAAAILYKVVKSASSNAEHNLKQKASDLYIKEIIVNQGPMYKRGVPISKGRTHPILKKTSHISVEVAVKEVTTKAAPVKKVEEPKAEAPKKEEVKKDDTKKK
jgi:large subunit ribosomal protein L22